MREAKHARAERNRWYAQVEVRGKSVKEVCEIFGISRKSYYKWRRRDRRWRLMFRTDLPSKVQPNTKLTTEVREFVREQKKKTNYGPEKMKRLLWKELRLKLSTTAIYRFYQKEKLIRRPQKRLPWYEPLKHKVQVKRPGEGVQMDVKYVYENGKRRYQFSVLDSFTELHHFTICTTKESKNCILAFENAQEYFGFQILSVQTDNGSEARGEFHRFLTKKNIPHYFIPKKSPWWNGNVERVHRTIDEEYYHNPFRVWKTPFEWLEYYNTERIHLTLGDQTPRERAKSVTPRC